MGPSSDNKQSDSRRNDHEKHGKEFLFIIVAVLGPVTGAGILLWLLAPSSPKAPVDSVNGGEWNDVTAPASIPTQKSQFTVINDAVYFHSVRIADVSPQDFAEEGWTAITGGGRLLLKNKQSVYYEISSSPFSLFVKLEGADPQTFRQVTGPYFKDNDNLYYYTGFTAGGYGVHKLMFLVEGADPDSFINLSCYYAKDKNAVYFKGLKMTGADPVSFKQKVGSDCNAGDDHDSYEAGKLRRDGVLSYVTEPITDVSGISLDGQINLPAKIKYGDSFTVNVDLKNNNDYGLENVNVRISTATGWGNSKILNFEPNGRQTVTFPISANNTKMINTTHTFFVEVNFIPVGKFDLTVYPKSSCLDSDGGKDYFVRGTVTTENEDGVVHQWPDFCRGDILHEQSCLTNTDSKFAYQNEYTCPAGCEDGARKPK